MAEESFKERIRLEMIKAAKAYKETYVDCEYLICSEAFVQKNYYIVDAKEDNFQHLTGVHSKLSAQSFFDRCIQGALSDTDFDFIRDGQEEKDVKGTVRRKIKVLPNMMELFREGLKAEESFKKNRVICSFATADDKCTLGFYGTLKARPRSLIKGNGLKNPKPVELVLKRKSGTELFDEIVIGDETVLHKYKEQLRGLLTEHLLELIADDGAEEEKVKNPDKKISA